MVQVCNINEMTPESVDFALAIVRSDRNIPDGVLHVPQLAPSWELFKDYLKWRDNRVWGATLFEECYVPRFIHELNAKSAKQRLNWIWLQSNRGCTVQVGCFCSKEGLCHRSVVGGILEGVGTEVTYSSGLSYAKYFDMWKKLLEV